MAQNTFEEKDSLRMPTREKKLIEEYETLIAKERDEHRKTKIKLKAKERELHAITQSTSYKLARILAFAKHGVKLAVDRAAYMNPKRIKMLKENRSYVKRGYSSPEFKDALSMVKPNTDLAVVLHLYYVEMLPFFADKFKALASVQHDLFISIPEHKKAAKNRVLKEFPYAKIVIVPNCGRDVLPFVQIMKEIEKYNYKKVLKLHSKKSPHIKNGQQWRDKLVGSLVPTDEKKSIEQIVKTLHKKKTAIIGPSGEYISLLVNFSATGHYIKNLAGKIVDTKLAADLINTPDEYGFFAGTMFWARVDALKPVIDSVEMSDFEPELGQEDSTLAHALERLFNVIPELQGRDMYEIQNNKIIKIAYHTSNIPQWSEVALDEN